MSPSEDIFVVVVLFCFFFSKKTFLVIFFSSCIPNFIDSFQIFPSFDFL